MCEALEVQRLEGKLEGIAEGRLEMARKGADTMFFHNMPYNQVFEAFGEVLGEDELRQIQEKARNRANGNK